MNTHGKQPVPEMGVWRTLIDGVMNKGSEALRIDAKDHRSDTARLGAVTAIANRIETEPCRDEAVATASIALLVAEVMYCLGATPGAL